jgi:RHS repeat-associated protein
VPADDIRKPVEEVKDNYEEQHNQQRQGVHETFGKCIGAWPELIDKYDLLKMLLEYKNDEKNFYYHSDHLGSAAYLTSGGDVTQTLNYLPYGEDWIDVQNNMDPRLGQYRFNGKEKDYESGLHYYGARYYWSELLTGWLSVDPMMDKYPGISPYNYCMWNPVKLVDPDGNIVLPYPGSKPEFIDYLNQVKAYLYANHSGDIIRQLDMLPIIIYVKEISFEEALEWRMAYNRNTNTIKWHPLAGLYTDENHLLSPTTVLNHEFDHALRYLLKPNQFIQDLITDDNSYDNREEERVITGSERQTAINLGEIFPWQITRKFHLGAAVKVKSPTSIEVQPPYRINSPIKELEEIEVNDSLDY